MYHKKKQKIKDKPRLTEAVRMGQAKKKNSNIYNRIYFNLFNLYFHSFKTTFYENYISTKVTPWRDDIFLCRLLYGGQRNNNC
jgi:hypothetical protein